MPGSRARAGALAAMAALLLAINAAGAFRGFPVMDDGELVVTAREAGLSAIAPANRDRPVNGWLIQESVRTFGERPAIWAAIAAMFWALLAWQTARLVLRLFPGARSAAGLAALLVIAPILVEMQYTTLTFVFAACLPVSLSLAGILTALGGFPDARPRWTRLLLGAGLVACAALVSEYALATLAAGLALLLTLRRTREAIALLAGGALGQLAFRAISDVTARAETMPSAQIANLRIGHQLLRWISGGWHSLVGAYGSAAGSVTVDASSRSSIAAALVGAGCAVALAAACRRDSLDTQIRKGRELTGLVLAIFAGLLPVAMAGRASDAGWFLSRFRLPIVPFAAAATVILIDRLIAARWRTLARAGFAFLAGYTTVVGAARVWQEQRLYDDVGRLLLADLRASDGLTVAVIADPRYGIGWGKLMYRWKLDDERRAWALTEGVAAGHFGGRGLCHGTEWLSVAPTLRNIGREGPIARLVQVRTVDGTIALEPYCVAAPR